MESHAAPDRPAYHKFDPAHADRLTMADRLRVEPPEDALRLLEPQAGQTVLDVGCGPGYYTLPIAARLQPGGRVLALDIAPAMLDRLRQRMTAAGVTNIEPLLCEESRLPVATAGCERILLANLLHELVEPERFLAEAARVLKPGGRGLALDWAPRQTPFGPPIEARVPPERACAWLNAAGLSCEPAVDYGPYRYAVVFRRE